MGKTREILIVERLDRKRGTVAGDERILFVCLNMTAASGRFFTMSENNLPGTTALPSSSTSAAVEYWMESSRSVAWRTSESPVASSKIPERTGRVERVDTPLITIARAFWSSLLLMLNFKETFSLSFLLRVIIQARADTDNLQLKASENSKLSFTQLLFHLAER